MAEAAWLGDKIACEKYGISLRTLQRIRRSAGTDVALIRELEVKKRVFEKRWLEELDVTIGAAVRAIRICSENVAADPRASKNPAVIKELASATKILADVKLANRVIDARLARLGQQELGGPVDESRQLQPGEVELAPGVIIMSPEAPAMSEAREFTTEAPSIIDLALEEHPEGD